MEKAKINLPEYFRHIMELETEIYCKNKIIDSANKMTAELPSKPKKSYGSSSAALSKLKAEVEELSCPKSPDEYMRPPVAPDAINGLFFLGAILLSVIVGFAIAVVYWIIDGHFGTVFCIVTGATFAIATIIGISESIVKGNRYKKEKLIFDENYKNACLKYKQEKDQYTAELSRCENALAKAKRDEENAIDRKYTNEVALWNQKCDAIENSVSAAKSEANKLKAPTKEAMQTLQKLYDFNIIYPKYRNMVAVCTICEYLESGRCTELEGPNGAYNLYESELRQNLIIGQLENVITNLQIIQNNQFQLYKKMDSIEKVLVSVDQKLNDVVKHAATISANINTIKDYTSDIAKSAQVTALASVVTAQYAEITARNTEAIKYITLIN